jgi:hypothetical protein
MLRFPIIGAAVLAAALLIPNAIDASAAEFAATTAVADEGAAFNVAKTDFETIGNLETDVFELALNAASCAVRTGAVGAPKTLTVIDYSKPSTERRLWVFDLNAKELVYEELVAHGQGTGANMATKFSNENESHQSSLGLFVTRDTYVGKNGYSLRLDGLDRGVNDRARERAIVMHGAPYVSTDFVKANGRLGRSWGCPAVSDAVAKKMIDFVKDGGLVFSYYPDAEWLKTSKYLGGCRA